MANENSQSTVNSIISNITASQLIVIDFSILMTLKNNELLLWILNTIKENDKPVLVTPEFYRCYEILEKSRSKEQQQIAANARQFVNDLSTHKNLKSNSKFLSTESLINSLVSNPDVMFMFSDCSEAAEMVRTAANPQAVIFFGVLDGKIGCLKAQEYIRRPVPEVYSLQGKPQIKVSTVPELGENVYDADGRKISLKKVISRGGEGIVYVTDVDGYVCKVYHARCIDAGKCSKLLYLEKRQVRFEGICWPEKVVYNSEKIPVGYLMSVARGSDMSTIFDGEETLLEHFPRLKRSDIVKVCISLLEKYQYLHLLGIIIGDIRMQNIIIDDNLNTYLIDLDSCQIENFPCEVGDEDYTPAEIQGKAFSTFLRTFNNERFAWSVVCFNCLFLGQHPYAQRNGLDSIAEEIALKTFRYPIDSNGDYSLIPYGSYKDIWKITPRRIRQFFYSVFKEGSRVPLSLALTIFDDYYRTLSEGQNRNSSSNEVAPGYKKDDDKSVRVVPKPDTGRGISAGSTGIGVKTSGPMTVRFPVDPPDDPPKKKTNLGPKIFAAVTLALIALLFLIIIITAL